MSAGSKATLSKVEEVLQSIETMSPYLNFILSLQTMVYNNLFGLIYTEDSKRVDTTGQTGIEYTWV